MRSHDELKDCFEVEVGTPTLTLELPGQQRMIAYSGFCDAVMRSGEIAIRFHDWLVTISGKYLDPLWSRLQMQDVRVVRLSDEGGGDECRVTQIEVVKAEE